MKHLRQKRKLVINSITFPSALSEVDFLGFSVLVKRDDQLSFYLSGNKLRKLFFLLNKETSPYTKIVSYGGLQSNAMLSMAAMAKHKGLLFEYYVRYIPKQLVLDEGNVFYAKELGMNLIVQEALNDDALGNLLRSKLDDSTFFINQGGAQEEAKEGIELLAKELLQEIADREIEQVKVVLPSGTGTTALFLQKALTSKIEVLTTACVGSKPYLEEELTRLEANQSLWPTILTTKDRYLFAKPKTELKEWYDLFKDQNIEFDLIYAPLMWQALSENKKKWENCTLIYVHTGGVLGNSTQLKRYEKLALQKG